MSHILENLRNVDPNNSDAVKEILSSFFQNVKHMESDSVAWLRTLHYVITRFPKYCVPHRATIEQRLARVVRAPAHTTVAHAARCAHSLLQVSGGGESAAACWRELMSSLCVSAHRHIDAMFRDTLDLYKRTVQVATPPLMRSSLDRALHDAHSDTHTLRSVHTCIQTMLVETFPVGKPVQPRLILDVIVKTLSVSGSVSTDTTLAATVKLYALRTLDALICCLDSNLIPYSSLVFSCVMQTLRWSMDTPGEPSRTTRCAAYGVLGAWLRVLRAYAPRAHEHELARHLVRDIAPPVRHVQPCTSNQYTNASSKKSRRAMKSHKLQRSGRVVLCGEGEGEGESCVIVHRAALRCAETFLAVCGAFLRDNTRKTFQEVLVRACYIAPDVLVLRALRASRASAPPRAPSAAHHLLHLCSVLQHCTAPEIRDECARILPELRLQLQCAPPSLYSASVPAVQRRAPTTSKNNRAALETLLGKERMNMSGDDVITISDEPSSKRARLADNISVSSESVESVDSGDDDVTQVTTGDVQTDDNNRSEPSDIDIVDEGTRHAHVTTTNIHEANTQPLINNSIDRYTVEDDSKPASIEIVYDTNVDNKLTTVLERMEYDNLPSSYDTDDVEITCGQLIQVNNSQVSNVEENKIVEQISNNVNKVIEISSETDKVNGINEAPIEIPQVNGMNATDVDDGGNVGHENIEVKITVDDMLADFVDELNEQAKMEA